MGGDGDYSGCSQIWAPLIIAHSAASTVIHLLNRTGGKRLVDGSSQTAVQALEFTGRKWAGGICRRVACPCPSLWEQLYQQQPLAQLEDQSPLNLNIRSLWFEALGCSAPSAHLKGKRDFHVPIAESHLTENLFLPPSPESKCTQTDCCTGAASLVWRKNKEMMEEEREREMEGGGRARERERKVKNLHITMPEKNQNIFHRKMGHFQILVPYQTN